MHRNVASLLLPIVATTYLDVHQWLRLRQPLLIGSEKLSTKKLTKFVFNGQI